MAKVSPLTVSAHTTDTFGVLTVDGLLDSSSYLKLRDIVIKAALDEPSAVLVDVTKLDVPASSAWAVFTSARWHVSTWPDVPIILICEHAAGRTAIQRNGVARYVPVYPTLDAALAAVTDHHRVGRRRTRTELPASLSSLRRARRLVAETLRNWSQTDFIPTANVIVTTFIENVLQHTESSPVVVLESDGATVTVAVRDNSSTRPTRHEHPTRGGDKASGLAIIASLCRAWGSTPMPSGKTVWAVVGPENQL
jgi:hypothetical protein